MNALLQSIRKHRTAAFYILWFVVTIALILFSLLSGSPLRAASCAFYSAVILVLYIIRPRSRIHEATLEDFNGRKRQITATVLVCLILGCILPMSLNPVWNGEYPNHRNQYELMAESLLQGKLYIDYPDEETSALESMENPYDTKTRDEASIPYHWDHAYYKGKYYMYFGVVPVLLVFLPYRIIAGTSLTTYHATQLFTALAILGIFRLFYLICRRFFRQLPLFAYTDPRQDRADGDDAACDLSDTDSGADHSAGYSMDALL